MLKYIGLSLGMLSIALGLQACGPQFHAQEDCNFVQNTYGERISWKGNIPVRLEVHQSFPQEHLSALNEAIEVWRQTAGRNLFTITNTAVQGPLTPRQDGVSMIYWMNTWEADKASEQARTSIYWLGDQILEADIRINDKNFNFYSQSPKSGFDVHLVSLLVHELGHVLGLKHNDVEESVMGTYLRANQQREQLSHADMRALSCEY